MFLEKNIDFFLEFIWKKKTQNLIYAQDHIYFLSSRKKNFLEWNNSFRYEDSKIEKD